MNEQGKLKGTLDALSLAGLLQLLAAESRTGRLDVVAPSRGGSLWLESGRLAHAVTSGETTLAGEPALDALIGLSEGSFSFEPGQAAPEHSLHGPTEQLLMEAAVRRDHARRGDPTAIGESAIPAFAPVPAGGSTPRFTTLQWRVLASIDGHKRVGEIAAGVGLPVATLAAILSELESAGVIQIT